MAAVLAEAAACLGLIEFSSGGGTFSSASTSSSSSTAPQVWSPTQFNCLFQSPQNQGQFKRQRINLCWGHCVSPSRFRDQHEAVAWRSKREQCHPGQGLLHNLPLGKSMSFYPKKHNKIEIVARPTAPSSKPPRRDSSWTFRDSFLLFLLWSWRAFLFRWPRVEPPVLYIASL